MKKKLPKTISDTMIYELPMVPVGVEPTEDVTVRVYCHAYEDDYNTVTVKADVPGYQPATFYTKFFNWLVYTKYIIEIGDEKVVYKHES